MLIVDLVSCLFAADGGYLEMSPGSSWTNKPNFPKPDRVQSYLSDDQSMEEFPKRAYSVGSKPAAIKNRNNHAYMDMTGKHGLLDKVNPKSSSAPHLVDKDKNLSIESAKLKDYHSKNSSSTKDLFMEFDFMTPKKDDSSFRPRTSSTGKEFRPQLSSIGQDIRRRTGSFGKDGINRTASMGRHDRPRTATICQDSFRNRTSSCGSSDMRPRSSSYGNRAQRKSKSTEKGSESNSRSSSRHSSQESLRRAIQKASQESLSKATQESYVDMSVRQSSSPSVMLTSGSSGRSSDRSSVASSYRSGPQYSREEEYLAMTPGDSLPAAGRSYMEMNFEREQEKDREWSHKKRTSDHSHKSGEHKSGKSKHRSSTRPHHHGLFLRMPTADTSKSSSDSLSSSGQSSDARNRDDSSVETADRSPGEYIDIRFSQKAPPLAKTKESSVHLSLGDQSPKVEWMAQSRASQSSDTYTVYTPGGTVKSPPSPAGLEHVVCPLRLDEIPPSTAKPRANNEGKGFNTSAMTTTPVGSKDTKPMQASPVGDPFALLSPTEKTEYMNIGLGQKQSSTEESEEKEKISQNSHQRRSPKLPPKSKSRPKLQASVVKGDKASKALSPLPQEVKPKIAVSPSVATVVEMTGSPSHMTTSPFCVTSQGTSDPAPSTSTLVTPPPKPLSAQKVQRTGSTSSLSSIESSLSHASAKVSIPSRGSASNLTSMDNNLATSSIATKGSNALWLRVGVTETGGDTMAAPEAMEDTQYENIAFTPGGKLPLSRHSSHNSVTSEKELNYASLDLASSMEEGSFPCVTDRGPCSPLIGKTTHSAVTDEPPASLAYAEIDFAKCESLRTAPSGSIRERLPFDVK